MHIHISNLNTHTNPQDILDLLPAVTRIAHCSVHNVRHPKTRETSTYALVNMPTADAAENAIQLLNNKSYEGRDLIVKIGA